MEMGHPFSPPEPEKHLGLRNSGISLVQPLAQALSAESLPDQRLKGLQRVDESQLSLPKDQEMGAW